MMNPQCGEVLNTNNDHDYLTVCTFAPRVAEHSHETAKNPYMRMLPLNTAVVERNGRSYVASTITMLDRFDDIPEGQWFTPSLEVLIHKLIGEIEDLQDRVYELETELGDHTHREFFEVEDKVREVEVMLEEHEHEVSFN